MTTPAPPLTRELLRMASTAPSVHNTQPWSWQVVGEDPTVVELRADTSRQLTATDPDGRDLVLSCGAALDHLELAADAFGVATEVILLPDPTDSALLARVRLGPGHLTDEKTAWLTALENRITDRRGFSDWEVPAGVLEDLARTAARPHVRLFPLSDPGDAVRAERLVERARQIQLNDPEIVREQDAWVRRGASDGVPPASANPHEQHGAEAPAHRYSRQATAPGTERIRGALLAICTGSDGTRAWLEAGRSLSRLWVAATRLGLMLLPLSQVIEVAETREALREEVFDSMAQPQLLVRLGWPATAAPDLPHTPRRSLAEVAEE